MGYRGWKTQRIRLILLTAHIKCEQSLMETGHRAFCPIQIDRHALPCIDSNSG